MQGQRFLGTSLKYHTFHVPKGGFQDSDWGHSSRNISSGYMELCCTLHCKVAASMYNARSPVLIGAPRVVQPSVQAECSPANAAPVRRSATAACSTRSWSPAPTTAPTSQ